MIQRVFFVSAAAFALASTSVVQSASIRGQDLFVFSRAWQPGNCHGVKSALCAKPTAFMKTDLTLDNLEPVNKNGKASTDACVDFQDGHFRAGSVQQAGQDDLRKYWPLVGFNVSEQWSAQTSSVNPEFQYLCTGMRQVEYLQKALEMAKASKTPAAVRDNVDASASASALRKESNGVLKCNDGGALSHVLTCWAGDLSAQIDCPELVKKRDTCSSDKVSVPAFK